MRLVKKKYQALGVLAIAIIAWQYTLSRKTTIQYYDRAGKEHILQLTIRDKKKLFGFMETLFAMDSFAYTLIGSKPVSFTNYHTFLPYNHWSWRAWDKYNRTLHQGWKTWEKYSHLFPVKFWAETSVRHPGSVSIFLVNEEKFNTVVSQHKEDFQSILSRKLIDGYQLLREAKNSSFEDEVLNGDQVLLGIALGYGKKNAQMFQESCRTLVPAGWVWKENEMGEELDEIPTGMTLTEFYLDQYSCPSFAGDPDSEESLALKKGYLETKAKVLQYYKGKDFLGATLGLLAGYRP